MFTSKWSFTKRGMRIKHNNGKLGYWIQLYFRLDMLWDFLKCTLTTFIPTLQSTLVSFTCRAFIGRIPNLPHYSSLSSELLLHFHGTGDWTQSLMGASWARLSWAIVPMLFFWVVVYVCYRVLLYMIQAGLVVLNLRSSCPSKFYDYSHPHPTSISSYLLPPASFETYLMQPGLAWDLLCNWKCVWILDSLDCTSQALRLPGMSHHEGPPQTFHQRTRK